MSTRQVAMWFTAVLGAALPGAGCIDSDLAGRWPSGDPFDLERVSPPITPLPIEQIDFVARHGGSCDVIQVGLLDGTTRWIPTINDVTPCPVGATDCLQKVELDAVAYPDAVCNDGSRAVMYVRINPVSSHWLIHLQAGGSCRSYEECYERWCHTDFYDASKMSTLHTPDAMKAAGIFANDPSNTFRTWNVVYGYYCSSDDWRGAASSVRLEQISPTSSDSMTVRYHGADIADAIIGTLQAGGTVTTARGETLELPDLDDAAQVVLSGSSAGAIGVRHHADAVGARLRASNPDVDFRAVFDSTHKPVDVWAADLLDGTCDSTTVDRYEDLDADRIASLAWDRRIGAVTDASCVAVHPLDPQLCAAAEHVLQFHVTTPFFARQGLYEKIGDDDDDGIPDVDPELWKDAAREGMQAYGDLAYTDPVTGEVREPLTLAPGWFAPDCSTHTAIDSNRFFDEIAYTNSGAAYDYEEVLSFWLVGISRKQLVQHDEAPIDTTYAWGFDRRSLCPYDGNDIAPICH